MKINKKFFLILIIFLSFLLRLFPLGFPFFTADEARIAYRGFSLARNGTDELGRKYPLIFNSAEDYQLPLTSYITAVGILIFGKTEFGVRIPFIIIGTLVVWLTFLISSLFTTSTKFRFFSVLITAFSPVLIYLSKFPNEWIILIFLLLLLFLNLAKKSNLLVTLILVILLLTSSKIAWFILVPFVLFTLIFYADSLSKKNKWVIVVACSLLTTLTITSFLRIPQSSRSLLENNLPLFSNITIQNGINRLRGQGIESNWPPLAEKLLFNKSHYVSVSFLHWLSNIGLNVFFGEFDKSGEFGFINLGAWAKILIIPFLLSLVNLIRKGGDKKLKLLWGYFIILTFPIFFLYPTDFPSIVSLTLPFMALIISGGFLTLKKKLGIFIISIMCLEIILNIFYINTQSKNMNEVRPSWIKKIMVEGYNASKVYPVAFSDDISSDIIPFFEWYSPGYNSSDYSRIDYPYKFHQAKLADIKIIGNDNSFINCFLDKPAVIFASMRDFKKIKDSFEVKIENTFQNALGKEIVYKLSPGVCIK